ncbi:MAG TPA: AraC family transcriptional regulator [Noviherbaspirillum sp.]|nr:AraC family transcriptional regulator [Noviherbaspirillum sp.]
MSKRLAGMNFVSIVEPVVPIHLPALLLDVVLEYGVDAGELLAGTDLRREHFSHPDTLLSYGQLAVIISRALQLTGNPRLGLHFGSRIRLSHQAELGMAYASAPTLRAAHQVTMRYQKLLGSAFDLRIVAKPDHVAIVASKLVPLAERYCFNQESWLSAIARLTAMVMEKRIEEMELEIEFDYPAPKDVQPFHAVFGDRVRFGRSTCQVLIPRRLLDEPLPGSAPAQFRLALDQCEKALGRNRIPQSLPARIRQLLQENLAEPLSAQSVAQRLNLSVRTMHRRLDELGSSYRDLLRDTRFETAAGLLSESNLPVTVIAHRAGFSDLSNFTKAFREWAGVTPGRYRQLVD